MSDTTLHPAYFKVATTQRSGWNPHGLRFVEGADPAAGGGDPADGGGDPPGDEPGDGGENPPADPPPDQQKRSLEDLLATLDDDARNAVLGQVSSARNEAKGLRRRLKDAEPKVAEYDRLAAASKTDLERSNERVTKLSGRLVRAEVKALATDRFTDPEDAHAFLDLESYVSEDGEVDAESIAADLDDLLERKPHLAKQSERRVPAPNPALGASGGGGGEPSVEDQIKEAQSKGDWRTVLHLQNQKLVKKAGK